MPELPEVQTTVDGLKSKVLNRTFIDVRSDWKKIIRLRSAPSGASARQVKKSEDFEQFKKEIKGKKIEKIWRRAKNIIFDLSGGYSLLVHQKMTGHLLVEKWESDDKANSYIHLIFYLDNGKMLALSDARKFAKAELWKTDELKKELEKLGPEPLEKSFSFKKFKETLKEKKARLRPAVSGTTARQGKIKQVLMNPEVIAGIGNIYSNEALWQAKINPEKNVAKLSGKELKLLYQAIKKVLQLGIKLGGESFSDYRNVEGRKGNFDDERKVYRRENEKCSRCGALIKRLKFGGRSAFFCPNCQKL